LLRQLAAISLCVALLFAAIPARSSRRPQYGGTLRIEIGSAIASLETAAPNTNAGPSDQASLHNQIASLIYDPQNSPSAPSGSPGNGAFRIASWQPGRVLALQANETFREGRPFVDGIDISMGRPLRDRLLDLELSKSDLIEIPAQDARHAVERGIRISQSQPDELLAIVFLENRGGTDTHARQALSLALDRTAIVTYLLQKFGEPSAALLPQWCAGTSFLFPIAPDMPRAKELFSQIAPSAPLVLGYDSADPLEQSVAERIVVNAKEAGIAIAASGLTMPQSQHDSNGTRTNALLVRVTMDSSAPAAALNGMLRDFNALGGANISASPLPDSATAQQIFDREREVLNTYRVVPLVWLPQVYGLSARVRNWIPPGPGQNWPLADVWLDQDPSQKTQGAASTTKDRE
jgi:ABC-type transport system substrate-binding protein